MSTHTIYWRCGHIDEVHQTGQLQRTRATRPEECPQCAPAPAPVVVDEDPVLEPISDVSDDAVSTFDTIFDPVDGQ